MTVSILIVDDGANIAELVRQLFRREVRQGLYVLDFRTSGVGALAMLGEGIGGLTVTMVTTQPVGFDSPKQQLLQLPSGSDERRGFAHGGH